LRIDILPFSVTEAHVQKAIKKLKNGKGSPDGCTAEMYKALPHAAFGTLALVFTRLFMQVHFPYS